MKTKTKLEILLLFILNAAISIFGFSVAILSYSFLLFIMTTVTSFILHNYIAIRFLKNDPEIGS